MKKLIVFILIIALLGCSTEQKVDENMKLSDYLEKMARGDKLNSQEVQHMKTLADEMDEKVAMWSKDGPQTLTVRSLRAQDAFFTNMPSGFMSMYQGIDIAIPDSTWTLIAPYSDYEGLIGDRASNSNDFFELDTTSGRIYIKQPGRAYAFYVRTGWDTNGTGHRATRVYQYQADGTEIANSAVYRIPAVTGASTSFATFIVIPWGNERNIGDYVTLNVYQTSGGSLNLEFVYFGAFVLR